MIIDDLGEGMYVYSSRWGCIHNYSKGILLKMRRGCLSRWEGLLGFGYIQKDLEGALIYPQGGVYR